MRRLLFSAVTAGALALGGVTMFPAAPASASLPPYCVLEVAGPGAQECDFNGVGDKGTFTLVTSGGLTTLTIDCDALRVHSHTTDALVEFGTYTRTPTTTSVTMMDCHARLSTSATSAAATIT